MHYSMLLLALDFQPSGNGSVPADRSLDVIIDKGMEGENHIVILCVILVFTFFFFSAFYRLFNDTSPRYFSGENGSFLDP